MSQDTVTNEDGTNQSDDRSLEQRMSALEEHNQELEAKLDQQQESGLSNMTRRGALGVLGGGALLGTAGSASAQRGNGRGGGAPFADEDHDHSGDYLGEGEPVSQLAARAVSGPVAGGDTISSFVGSNLSVNDDGSLSAASGNLTGIHEADPNADDIGAEIQRIHDEEADPGDGIYVPPREYHNQHTPIKLSKPVSLFSVGDSMHNHTGAMLYKQGDFVSIEITYERRGARNKGSGYYVSGITFSGEDVDDSSHGVVIHSVVKASINTEHHGGYGCFFENSNDKLHNTNWSQARIRSLHNSGDGIRIENTSGNSVNLNAMRLEVRSAGNDGDGVVDRDGYDNRFYGDSSLNGGKGWDIDGRSQFGVIRQEQNGEKSVFPAPVSIYYSLTPVRNRIDFSSVPNSTQIQRGARKYNGMQVVQGDIELGGGDLTEIAKYEGSSNAPNDTVYLDTADMALEYKDTTGSVHVLTNNPTGGNGGGGGDGGGTKPDTVYYEAGKKTITPDGDLETDGLSTWSVTNDGTIVKIVDGNAAGTVGGDVWLSWDADNLYFSAAIDDQTHAQPYDVGQLFNGDNVQFAVAPGAEGWDEFLQYTLALTKDGTVVYGQVKGSGTSDASVRNFNATIVRDDTAETTRYEVAIPWTELDAIGGFDPTSDEYLGVDWAILDNDGSQRDGIENYVKWDVTGNSAITGGKQPSQLKATQLLD